MSCVRRRRNRLLFLKERRGKRIRKSFPFAMFTIRRHQWWFDALSLRATRPPADGIASPGPRFLSQQQQQPAAGKTPTHGVILIKKFTHSFQATGPPFIPWARNWRLVTKFPMKNHKSDLIQGRSWPPLFF